MTLLEMQQTFSVNLAKLVLSAVERGYGVTFGEVWRSPETAASYAAQGKGISRSLHIERLAADLNLFKDGRYLPLSTDHYELGQLWKKMHPLNRWGGDFGKPDGNHYSMEYQGRK